MTFRPRRVRVAHAYEQVSAELEAQILDGRLRPGDRLPGEVELAALFGVNRSTVREGIRRLESEGLVRRPTPRRLVVSAPRAGELASRTSRAMQLQQVTFLELWHVALATEPLAADLAAREARPEDVAALQDNQRRMEAAVASPGADDPVKLDTEFHALVATASGNRALQLAREPIGLLLYSGMALLAPRLPQAQGRQAEAHGRIVAAIAARDPDAAREWMRKHIVDYRRGHEMAGLPLDLPVAAPPARQAPGHPAATLRKDT